MTIGLCAKGRTIGPCILWSVVTLTIGTFGDVRCIVSCVDVVTIAGDRRIAHRSMWR